MTGTAIPVVSVPAMAVPAVAVIAIITVVVIRGAVPASVIPWIIVPGVPVPAVIASGAVPPVVIIPRIPIPAVIAPGAIPPVIIVPGIVVGPGRVPGRSPGETFCFPSGIEYHDRSSRSEFQGVTAGDYICRRSLALCEQVINLPGLNFHRCVLRHRSGSVEAIVESLFLELVQG